MPQALCQPFLRIRLQDIPILLAELLQRYGKNAEALAPSMREAMMAYSWPGNVRELLAFFESYLILLEGKPNDEKFFRELLRDWSEDAEKTVPQGKPAQPTRLAEEDLKTQLSKAKQEIVRETLRRNAWNRRLAASRLGISYNTLWRILGETDDGGNIQTE